MNSGRVEFPKEVIRGFSQGACQMVQFFFCRPTIVVRADLEFLDEGFYRGSTIISSQLDPRMTGVVAADEVVVGTFSTTASVFTVGGHLGGSSPSPPSFFVARSGLVSAVGKEECSPVLASAIWVVAAVLVRRAGRDLKREVSSLRLLFSCMPLGPETNDRSLSRGRSPTIPSRRSQFSRSNIKIR